MELFNSHNNFKATSCASCHCPMAGTALAYQNSIKKVTHLTLFTHWESLIRWIPSYFEESNQFNAVWKAYGRLAVAQAWHVDQARWWPIDLSFVRYYICHATRRTGNAALWWWLPVSRSQSRSLCRAAKRSPTNSCAIHCSRWTVRSCSSIRPSKLLCSSLPFLFKKLLRFWKEIECKKKY